MTNRRTAKPYQCDICGGRFKTVPGLLGHKRFRHKDVEADVITLVEQDLIRQEAHEITVKVEELRIEFLRLEKAVYESDEPETEKRSIVDGLRNDYLFRILAAREGLSRGDEMTRDLRELDPFKDYLSTRRIEELKMREMERQQKERDLNQRRRMAKVECDEARYEHERRLALVLAQQQEEDRRVRQEQYEMNVTLMNAFLAIMLAITERQQRDESHTSLLRSAVYEILEKTSQDQTGIWSNGKPTGEPFEIKTIPQAFWAVNHVINKLAPYASPEEVADARRRLADLKREYVMNLLDDPQADLNRSGATEDPRGETE